MAAEGRALPSPRVAYNVKTQFGAKGDGRADDSGPLLRAVAAANANPAGGVVYLPAGSYVLRWPLTITRSRVVLRGAGVSWQGLEGRDGPVRCGCSCNAATAVAAAASE